MAANRDSQPYVFAAGRLAEHSRKRKIGVRDDVGPLFGRMLGVLGVLEHRKNPLGQRQFEFDRRPHIDERPWEFGERPIEVGRLGCRKKRVRLVIEYTADGDPDEAANDERRRRQIASELKADSHGLDRVGVPPLGNFEPGLGRQKSGEAPRVLHFRQVELERLESVDILQLIVPVTALATSRFMEVVIASKAVDEPPHFVPRKLVEGRARRLVELAIDCRPINCVSDDCPVIEGGGIAGLARIAGLKTCI